jgi:hypothetical protein
VAGYPATFSTAGASATVSASGLTRGIESRLGSTFAFEAEVVTLVGNSRALSGINLSGFSRLNAGSFKLPVVWEMSGFTDLTAVVLIMVGKS